MRKINQVLQFLDQFERELPRLYPHAIEDYRGRIVSSESVLSYLRNEKQRFAEIAVKLPVPSRNEARLLDIGIAYGFLPVLLKRLAGWQCEGIELPENIPVYCHFAKNEKIPIYPAKLGLSPLPFEDESFEAIIFSEVLEHLRLSPSIVFKELKRLLLPGGFLVVTTPNMARLTNVVKLFLGLNPVEAFPEDVQTENITERMTHIREYTMGELSHLIQNAGLDVYQSNYSSCMERGRMHFWLTQLFSRWRGNLFVIARKRS